MKKYEYPELNIQKFDAEDIITASKSEDTELGDDEF